MANEAFSLSILECYYVDEGLVKTTCCYCELGFFIERRKIFAFEATNLLIFFKPIITH